MSEYIPIPKKRIKQFMLEAQSHIGLPTSHTIISLCADSLSRVLIAKPLIEGFLDDTLNACIKLCDKNYKITKTWKSYDW